MNLPIVREHTTPGGAVIISNCLQQTTLGNAHWLLWRDTCNGDVIGTWIELAVEIDHGLRTFREGKVWRCDCPVGYFKVAPVVDQEWRDRCWEYAESECG